MFSYKIFFRPGLMADKYYKPSYLKLSDMKELFEYVLFDETAVEYINMDTKSLFINLIKVKNNLTVENLRNKFDEDLICVKFHEEVDNFWFFNYFNGEWLTNTTNCEAIIKKSNIFKYCLACDISTLNCYKHNIKYDRHKKEFYLTPWLRDDWYETYGSTEFHVVFLDCEMYLTTYGREAGRISILDEYGNVIFDEYIKSENRVINYCTEYSGLTEETNKTGMPFHYAMCHIIDNIIGKNTLVCAHAIENDMKAMRMFHRKIVDTAHIFRSARGHAVKLKLLCEKYLGYSIQNGPHDSVEDARAVYDLIENKIKRIKEFELFSKHKFSDCKGKIKLFTVNTMEELGKIQKTDEFLNVFLLKEDGVQYVMYRPEIRTKKEEDVDCNKIDVE